MAENHHLDRKEPPWYRLAPLLVVLVVIGFYWKLVLTSEYTWLQSPDIAYQVLPWYQFEASEWHQGRFPMWDPNHWLGQPMLGQTQPGLAYPLNWALFSLRLKNGWIRQSHLHWYFVVIHVMAALFAYALARDLKRSRAASVLAGLVFALAAYIGNIDWPQMLNGAVWAPLVFLYIFRVFRGERPWTSTALGGLFLGMAWLSGHHQIPIYTSLAAGGTWLYFLLSKKQTWRTALALAALFWVVTAMAGALQMLPAQEYGKLSVRWIGLDDPVGWDQKVPYDIHKRYGLTPASVLGIVIPGWYTHVDPFVGVTVVMLLFLALRGFWHWLEVRVLAAVGLGGLLFAMAHHNLFHGWMYALVPLVDKARSPSMAVFLFGFGAALLAAFGLDRLMSREDGDGVRRIALVATAFGGFIWLTRLAVVIAKGSDSGFDDRYLMTMIAALLAAGLFWGWYRGTITAAWCATLVIGLFLMEAGNDAGYFQPSRFEKNRENMLAKHAQDSDIVEFLRRQPGPIRVMVNDKEISYNFGDWWGIHTLGGYLASVTSHFQKQEPFSHTGRRLLGVGYWISSTPDTFFTEELFKGTSGRKVFVNRDVYPRSFVVHKATTLPTRDRVSFAMNDSSDSLRNRTFMVTQAPALETCDPASDNTHVALYEPNRVRIRATLGCRGMVILTDTYYPGWEATVDGKAAPIHEAYALVRGVVAEKGTHDIEFRYRPKSVIWGGVLSASSLLLCGVVAWLERSKRLRTSY